MWRNLLGRTCCTRHLTIGVRVPATHEGITPWGSTHGLCTDCALMTDLPFYLEIRSLTPTPTRTGGTHGPH